MTDASTPIPAQADARPQPQRKRRAGPARQAQPGRTIHPLLEQLAQLHPLLFGARFRPLKLGTFQDLMERHPGAFEPAALKEALGQHTRSTRYLESLARGDQRHDLDGQPVGALALDHHHHALVELFKRRQGRSREDLQPALRARVRELFVQSGLDRDGYAQAAKVQPDALAALLDMADLDQADEIARREALLRAFEIGGVSEAQFADQYGLAPDGVAALLAQARDDRRVRAAR
ncbi:ProQ/FINO family protein [Pseudorhodoferax sp.]|uniref:ProQ/FINO family protein n=1 Tax=Pseudorhodoferax sp. TaxID=1993553 RepID=UPI002DD682DE|nr:ProQ/FINO family protein [Pseudorhodoferax sp.]